MQQPDPLASARGLLPPAPPCFSIVSAPPAGGSPPPRECSSLIRSLPLAGCCPPRRIASAEECSSLIRSLPLAGCCPPDPLTFIIISVPGVIELSVERSEDMRAL